MYILQARSISVRILFTKAYLDIASCLERGKQKHEAESQHYNVYQTTFHRDL